MRSYGGSFNFERQDDKQKSRTYEGRLNDHIEFLESLKNRRDARLKQVADAFFNKESPDPLFIDIGPGVANLDAPAISSVEMAEKFPQISVVALDLKDEFEKFKTKVPESKKTRLKNASNLYILPGDGLRPLREQVGLPTGKGRPIIIRAANSIDLYCQWNEVKPALERMAQDFRENPVLLFFNREIVYKPKNSLTWRIIGQVSDKGFDHNLRPESGGPDSYRLKEGLDLLASK